MHAADVLCTALEYRRPDADNKPSLGIGDVRVLSAGVDPVIHVFNVALANSQLQFTPASRRTLHTHDVRVLLSLGYFCLYPVYSSQCLRSLF